MFRRINIDWPLIGAAFALTVFGIAMVYSAGLTEHPNPQVVRAWRAPDLTLTRPQLFFLGATDTRVVTLALEQVQGVGVTAAVAPSPPFLDEPTGLAVTVATPARARRRAIERIRRTR